MLTVEGRRQKFRFPFSDKTTTFAKKSSADHECFDTEMKVALLENSDEGLVSNLSVIVSRRFDVCVFSA